MDTTLTPEELDRLKSTAKLEILWDPATDALLVAAWPCSDNPAILALLRVMSEAARAHLTGGLASMEVPGSMHRGSVTS